MTDKIKQTLATWDDGKSFVVYESEWEDWERIVNAGLSDEYISDARQIHDDGMVNSDTIRLATVIGIRPFL